MGKKPQTLKKIQDYLDQLPFSDQQKADWVSVYRDRYQILYNKGVGDTVRCILLSLIFGDKNEKENALKLLELTFVKRDHLEGVGHTIDSFRHSPELLVDGVNHFREITRLVRTGAYKNHKEWEKTYGAALQGEQLEAVMKDSGVPLTEEQKATIRAKHKLYAKRLERDKAREKEQKTTFEDAMANNDGTGRKTKRAKTPFKGAQDALDLINDTGLHAEIKMERLADPRSERYFAMSVFAAMYQLAYEDVFEIYTDWENKNPPDCPPKSEK